MSQPIPFSLRQLEYVLALAQEGTFHAAARACHVSQPALSKQLKLLEEQLDSPLFERSRPQVIPTAKGQEVIRYAQQILGQCQQLIDALNVMGVGDELKGTLNLGTIPTIAPYLLPGFILKIKQRWPALTLIVHELQTAPLLEQLGAGTIDLALLATPVEHSAQLVSQDLFEEPFVLAAPLAHPLATTPQLDMDALRDQPLILMDEGHCFRDHALAVCSRFEAKPQTQLKAGSVSTLLRLVESGLGVTLIPSSALLREAASTQGVHFRRFERPSPTRQISLMWRKSSPRACQFEQLARAFIEHSATLLL